MIERETVRTGRSGRWLAVGVIAATLVLAAVFVARFGVNPRQVDSPLIGRQAPDLSLELLDEGGTLALTELQGQVVVVNFFASWCVACRFEHDDLVTAQAVYEDAGVRFVGIVYQDSPAAARAMLDELGRGYPAVLDPDSRAAIEFGVFGVPETFFIDRNGKIVAKVFGESNLELLASIIDSILLGEVPESRTTGTVQPGPGG